MQASLYLRAPQLSATLHCPRSGLQRQFSHDNHFALRSKTSLSHGSLSPVVRAQTPSSIPALPPRHESSNLGKKLALVVGVAVTVAMAGAMGYICPSWSRSGRIGLASQWQNISVTGGEKQGRPESRRGMARKELQNQAAMRQQIADQVLLEMFKRKDLPEEFYKITPNYPMIKEYFEDHLRLSDESWETLIGKWKEIKPGPDQIEIGLLVVDLCITKGDVIVANEIDEKIKEIAPELDQRPKIRREIINMIKDWDKKKEWEKRKEWEKFATNMQNIASSLSIAEPGKSP